MTETVTRARSSEKRPLSRKEFDETKTKVTDYVDLEQLPKFSDLREQVQKVVDSSSWFERYGKDWIIHLLGVVGWFGCHFLLASPHLPVAVAAIVILGFCHYILSFKAGHCSVHGSLSQSKVINKLGCFVFSDFFGSFSTDVGYDAHIKCHHPHTNIIGLGDSSTWRVPFVPRYLYMFVTPLTIPIITPLVSLKECLALSLPKTLRHVCIAGLGLYLHFYLLLNVSQLSIYSAFSVFFLSRNILAIPYIHVNIFQHIGLPMYSQKHRPRRIYQMLTGVLNLPRNPILDYCFGHGIINCHVEHHLFPHLSDNMCLRVKPVVSKFCQENDLPYHFDTYASRTNFFLRDYQQLMVNMPPITSFVGLQ